MTIPLVLTACGSLSGAGIQTRQLEFESTTTVTATELVTTTATNTETATVTDIVGLTAQSGPVAQLGTVPQRLVFIPDPALAAVPAPPIPSTPITRLFAQLARRRFIMGSLIILPILTVMSMVSAASNRQLIGELPPPVVRGSLPWCGCATLEANYTFRRKDSAGFLPPGITV